MNKVRILNYVSYAAVLLSYALTGLVTSVYSGVYKHTYNSEMPGTPLPNFTEWILPLLSYPTTFTFELALGLLFFGLFLFLEHGNTQRRAYLPACLTAALMLSWVQLLIVFVALALPLVRIID